MRTSSFFSWEYFYSFKPVVANPRHACHSLSGTHKVTIYIYIYIYRVLKNKVYNVSGMIEEVETNMLFIWQNFGLFTVLPLDGLKCRCLDFRHNKYRLVLFVLLRLQQVETVITVSKKTCYDKYSKCVCVNYPFSCHSMLQCWNVFTFVLHGGFHFL